MWRGLLLVLTAALLQGFMLAPLGQVGIGVNLVLVVVVLAAFWLPLRSLLGLALWGGFWLDVFAQQLFGLRSVFFLGLVGLIWLLKRGGLEFRHLPSVIALIVVGTFLYRLVLFGGVWWELEAFVSPIGLAWLWLLEAGVNAAFALLLRGVIKLVVAGQKEEARIEL